MAFLCAIAHKWTEWQDSNPNELAAQLGIDVPSVRYRYCERCGTSEIG